VSEKIVVVITGCSSGIGLETAKYLRERFIKVYPTAREIADVERLKSEYGFENAMKLDVRKPDEISDVIESVLEQEGRIDVWFNNAGYGQMGAIEDLPTDALREQFETNLFGLHECTRQIVPVMRRQGFGKIIQHSSVLGLVSLPWRGAYNASKYAVEGLTDTLRLELDGSGIYPVLLNTGPIASRFRENAIKTLSRLDKNSSVHNDVYEKAIRGDSKSVPFKLEAKAVAAKVHLIIMSEKPAPRYYITSISYIFGYLKRILSTSLLDRMLLKV